MGSCGVTPLRPVLQQTLLANVLWPNTENSKNVENMQNRIWTQKADFSELKPLKWASPRDCCQQLTNLPPKNIYVVHW
jgi:hypothetical protein